MPDDDKPAEFVALMTRADEASVPEAPYGYTKDPETGEMRPKKTAGRPRKSPSLEELKADKEAAAAETPESGQRQPDRAPAAGRGRGRQHKHEPKPEPEPLPAWREGVIAKGINKLYRRAGRIIRVGDPDIGQALIEITRKDTLDNGEPDPEDITVGEAWEELARTNPRIRRWLLKIIAGGAWGQLVMAHAPVLLAILMKDAVRKRIPLIKLIEAFFADDGDDEGQGDNEAGTVPAGPLGGLPNLAGLVPGLTDEDMAQMMQLAQSTADRITRRAGTPSARPRQSAGAPAAISPPAG